jgi:DNA-binding response OmpR family regulator
MAATIVLIEDDPEIAQLLHDVLVARDYVVHHALGGEAGMRLIREVHPDLVILDLLLPDSDGLLLCADIRSVLDVPVIICSATRERRDALLGFKLGADDFVPKPFEPAELEARVEAVLRRTLHARIPTGPNGVSVPVSPDPANADENIIAPALHREALAGGSAPADPNRIVLGSLEIDSVHRSVKLGTHSVPVTPTEYRLLRALASRAEIVLSREELAQQVWGYYDHGIGRAIDVHIRRLRVKLAAEPVTAPPIVSIRGFGYKITLEAGIGAADSGVADLGAGDAGVAAWPPASARGAADALRRVAGSLRSWSA